MKKFIKYFLPVVSIVIVLFSMASCRDNDDSISTEAPVINQISAAVDSLGQSSDLVATTVGYANNTYVIQGEGFATLQHIYFNGYESYFNPNLVTDNTIIVTIDEDTPYADVSNKLKLVTKYGTVEYDFTVAPPAPVIDGFNSINAADGDNITIKGNYFVDPVVKVGDIEATISSYSLTEIIAVLPAGAQGNLVSVTTLSGTATYGSEVGTAFYDDVFYGSTIAGGWGETHNLAYSEDADNIKQGEQSIELTISAWSGFQLDNAPAYPSAAKGLRFWAKATTEGSQNMQVMINSNWTDRATIDITTDFQEYRIPWSTFGLSATPTVTANNIIFFNQGTANVYYIDDLGYYY